MLAVNLSAEKDGRITEYLGTLFRENGIAVSLRTGGWYLQLVLETNMESTSFLFSNITPVTSFEAIVFLHSFSRVSSLVKFKDCRIAEVYYTRTILTSAFNTFAKLGD